MDATDKLKQAVFDDETRTTILGNIDKQEIMHDLVKTNVDTTGVEVMDCVMRQVANQINKLGIIMKYEKILQQSSDVSTASEFKSIAKMWNWTTPDQAGFNNSQKPDAVYQMTVHNNRMYLFVEVDGNVKSAEPQVTAMKLWQSVTFGRVRKSDMSVGSLRINMDSMPKQDVQHHHKQHPQPTPGEIYEWMVNIVKACVFVVGNFIAHNLRHDTLKKFQRHSRWSQVLGTQDDTGIRDPKKSTNVYDMHFFVGVYDTQFYSKCSTGQAIPADKQVDFDLHEYKKQSPEWVLPSNNTRPVSNPRNHYWGDIGNYKTKSSKFYRPTCTLQAKLNQTNRATQDAMYAADKICLKVDLPSTVYHGEETGHGANINYIFMQRVNQRDIDAAVTDIKSNNSSPQHIESRFAKVHGLWYLQDMVHFLDRAKLEWGAKFEEWLTAVIDANGNTLQNNAGWMQRIQGQNYPAISFPKGWQHVDQEITLTNGGQSYTAKAITYYTVYHLILESFVAEMENVYHGLITDLKPNPSWGINDMAAKIKQIKQKHNRNVLEVKKRVDNTVTVRVRKNENLRHRLLFAAHEFLHDEVELEDALIKYLTQYKSEYMQLFCRMIQCQTMLGLITIAHNYTQNLDNTLIERHIATFTLGVQSEIRFMLRSVASDNQLLMRNSKFDPDKIIPEKGKSPILQRVEGGFIFGSKPSTMSDDKWFKEKSVVLTTEHNDVWECLNKLSRFKHQEKSDWLKLFTHFDGWQYTYWFRQDYLKGVDGADRHGLLQISQDLQNKVTNDVDTVKSCNVLASYYVLQQPFTAYQKIKVFLASVRQLFSVQLKPEYGSLMPVLFYSRILWVCRAIALDSIDEQNDTAELFQRRHKSWNERYKQCQDGDFTKFRDYRISETLANGIVAVEGFRLLTSGKTLANYNEAEKQLLKRLHTLLKKFDVPEDSKWHLSYTVNDLTLYVSGVLDQGFQDWTTDDELIQCLLNLDDQNGYLYKKDTSEFMFCNEQIDSPQFSELNTWLPRLGLFMRFQSGFVLAEIEVVIKGLIIDYFIEMETNDPSIDNYLNRNPHARKTSIAQPPLAESQAAKYANTHLPGVQGRHVLFPQTNAEWTLSSYASLRDFNLIRQTHFYGRLYHDKIRIKYGVINVKIMQKGNESIYAQVINSHYNIENVYGERPEQLPMFNDDRSTLKYLYLEPDTWKKVFDIVRKTLAGEFVDDLVSWPAPFTSGYDKSKYATFEKLPTGEPSDKSTTVAAAESPYTIYLYQDPSLELDQEEKLLRDSLYKYCCLSHTTLEYNEIKPILQDYQIIENRYVEWYKKLEYDAIGHKKIKIDDDEVTVLVHDQLTSDQTAQVNHYKRCKCPHQHNTVTRTNNYVKCQQCSEIRLDFIYHMSRMEASDHEIRFERLCKWKFLAMARVRMIWFENSLFHSLETWTSATLQALQIDKWTEDKRDSTTKSWLARQVQHWKTN